MTKVSLSELAALTGKTWRTIRSRLQAAGVEPIGHEGRSDLFDSVRALDAIFEIDRAKVGELNLQAERAALARAQREKLECDAAVRAGELLPLAQVQRDVGEMITACRSRLLAVPNHVAQILTVEDGGRITPLVREKIHEALSELSNYQPGSALDG